MNVAIVIPAFKESQNIENLIKSILEVLNDPFIVIVDDSPDKEIEEIVNTDQNKETQEDTDIETSEEENSNSEENKEI